MIVAIDGPAASGKSTVAKEVASRLGYTYIDSGAMFRALTYWALEEGLKTEDELKGHLKNLKLKSIEDGIELNGRKLYQELRGKEVDEEVSYYSAMASVRKRLKEIQIEESLSQNVVMDGRDIGTCVFPQAEVKVFLTATAEERAKRRFLQRSNSMEYEEILEEILRRDAYDSSRKIAPLVQAEDALLLDTSHMSLEEVFDRVEEIIRDVSENS